MLIGASELARRQKDHHCIVVDCRFNLLRPTAGYEAYCEGHIPGARYANLDRDLAATPQPHEGRHPLPKPADFAATLGSWGICNRTLVVAYDDTSGAIAARLWWMLRWIGHDKAAVLDGGIQSWIAEGLGLERESPAIEVCRYTLGSVHSDWVVTTEELRNDPAAVGTLLDARSPDRFDGRSEPIDPVAGHVPGAVNWPFDTNIRGDGAIRSIEEISAELAKRTALDTETPLVTMCGSGVTACHLLLVMEHAGISGGRLYAGSWSEWIRDPNRPVEKATEP